MAFLTRLARGLNLLIKFATHGLSLLLRQFEACRNECDTTDARRHQLVSNTSGDNGLCQFNQ